jgi:hypothetical protein
MPELHPHAGGHPITLARIRDWKRHFDGAPSTRVPFGAHAVKYLLEQIDALEMAMLIQAHEEKVGVGDSPDHPWIANPTPPGSWNRRIEAYQNPGRAKAIPYADPDAGTEKINWSRFVHTRVPHRHPSAAPSRRPQKRCMDSSARTKNRLAPIGRGTPRASPSPMWVRKRFRET